jgi:hypothetical protein
VVGVTKIWVKSGHGTNVMKKTRMNIKKLAHFSDCLQGLDMRNESKTSIYENEITMMYAYILWEQIFNSLIASKVVSKEGLCNGTFQIT